MTLRAKRRTARRAPRPDPIRPRGSIAAIAYDWSKFYSALAAAVNERVSPEYGTAVTLVQPQGEFLWHYRNRNGVFNQGTFDFVSARVKPAANPQIAALSPSGGFPNAYVEVIAKIVYGLSTADTAKIRAATNRASVQASTIVIEYLGMFGPIDPAQIAFAQQVCGTTVQTPLDYVISYMAGAVWSGRQEAGRPLLTYEEMKAAGDPVRLRAQLPELPDDATAIVVPIWDYLSAVSLIADLQSQAQHGSWLVAQLLSNTSTPTPANGGMQTVDPNTGALLPFQVSYGIGTSIQAIATALADTTHTLHVTAALTPVSPQLIRARVETHGDMQLPSSGLALFVTPHSTTDLVAAAPSEVEITIEYPGYTLVRLSAGAWSDQNDTNWFLAEPIADAYRHGTADRTGFRFIADPNYELQAFADGGTFGMLTSLLISAAPTVTFVYTDAEADTFRLVLPDEAGTLKLFSLLELTNYRAVTLHDSASRTRRLVFQPVVEVDPGPLPVPTLMQSAFPIGCTISNPAVDV